MREVDDIEIVKYLERHRRNTQAAADVDVIDAIMHRLFTVRSAPVPHPMDGAAVGEEAAELTSEAEAERKAYMRDYMRRKRAAAQALKPE